MVGSCANPLNQCVQVCIVLEKALRAYQLLVVVRVSLRDSQVDDVQRFLPWPPSPYARIPDHQSKHVLVHSQSACFETNR